MAHVYADMDALAAFQKQIGQTLPVMEEQVNCNEDLIVRTRQTIQQAIMRAEAAERAAYASMQSAEEQLRRAERQTREYNANLAEDQSPMTTPSFYYDNVYETGYAYSSAQATRAHTEDTLSDFDTYVRNYKHQQEDGIAQYKKLLNTSLKFFEKYIDKLIKAKKCTVMSGIVRAAAVKSAWAREAGLVRQGRGTRDWTVDQQAELLKYGSVSGFEGQHMKNVADYPEFAGDPNNIQFLTSQEHLHGAPDGSWQTSSNGWLDVRTGQMIPFGENEKPSVPVFELTNKYNPTQPDLATILGGHFAHDRREGRRESRKRIFSTKKD